MDTTYFKFKTYGKLQFDPRNGTKHYEPWWALLNIRDDTTYYYGWLLKKHGLATEPNGLWGPHVSVIKGQEPILKSKWGIKHDPIEFWYTNQIRYDNGKHAWLDVFSPEMSNIRESLGLPPKCFFHLTIGRLK